MEDHIILTITQVRELLAEIEAAIEDASCEGYDAGRAAGYDAGNEAGYEVGYEHGEAAGSEGSFANGVGAGYDDGYESGFADGYDEGYVTAAEQSAFSPLGGSPHVGQILPDPESD